ncbi:MAG: DUF4363 family protein [Clostridia bacterium]|nr:DUF4363 family protein [Clostridia bacterium]
MKKLVVISILFIALIGVGIFETVSTYAYFSDLSEELTALSKSVITTPEDKINDSAVEEADRIMLKWEEKRGMFYVFYNNNVLNSLFDRITQAKTYLHGGRNIDARASLDADSFFASTVARDILPIPINYI